MLVSLSVLVLLAAWPLSGKTSVLLGESAPGALTPLHIQVFQSRGFPDQYQNPDPDLDQDQSPDQEQKHGGLLHKRDRRGAEEEEEEETGEQQSTFSHSYENEFLTTPRATEISNSTQEDEAKDEDEAGNEAGDEAEGDEDEAGVAEAGAGDSNHENATDRGVTLFHNPFFPVTDSSYSAYAILFLALLVLALGIVGNLAVMCIVWHNYYMRSSWNYILASMAFWDFLVLCFCLPVVVFNELTNKRLLGDVSCRLVPYMEVTSLGVTSFSLCALGIDRFHAATSSQLQPKARRVERCRSVLLKLLFVWLGSMALASPELLLWQLDQTVSPATAALVDTCSIQPTTPQLLPLPDSLHSLLHSYHQARTWWYFGCYFCLPVVFTLLCQLATCHVAEDASAASSAHLQRGGGGPECSASAQREQEARRRAERRLGRTVLALAVFYAACTLPENASNIAMAYVATPVSHATAAVLALVNHFLLFFKAAVTPILMLCLCRALAQAFMDCCCCCCEVAGATGNDPADPAHATPGPDVKLKSASETSSASIYFDKAKESSTILSIGSASS